LWGREGKRAKYYLEVQRGLTENVIIQAGLGYIPGGHIEWKTIEGLKVPCGITIPWFAEGAIWGIKVRRAAGQQRYQQVRGGNIKGCLYLADTIQSGLPIMLTEGEFDALIAKQVSDGVVCATSIGSAANKHTNPRWFPKFITAPSILVCMDADEAGENAAFHIHGLSQAAKCIRIPLGKDLNEFYQLAGRNAVRNWINEIVGQDEK
jgi:DNA primase